MELLCDRDESMLLLTADRKELGSGMTYFYRRANDIAESVWEANPSGNLCQQGRARKN